MLAPEKLQQLQSLINQSTASEWLWMSGYLAALAAGQGDINTPVANAAPADTITILYGTETGNSKKVATQLTGKLKQNGHKTKLLAAENFKPEQLSKESLVILAISTQGEGEPPANARALYDFVHNTKENLGQLRYSIVALGSRSYPLFCQAGIDIDTQLKRLNAKPVIPITLCDDDYESVVEAWTVSLLNTLGQSAAKSAPVVISKTESKKSFKATLGSNTLLNDKGSQKAVHHLEFDLPEELLYTPGNAVGIVPKNADGVVRKILSLLQVHPDKKLQFKGIEQDAFTLLRDKVSVTYLTLSVIKKYAQLVQADIPETRMDLYDLLRIYPMPSEFEIQELVDVLNPITPRLYTISSSPNAHPGQLHLTAELHHFESHDEKLNGFGSKYLTQMKPGTQIEMFLHQQKNFQLPRTERHLVMIAQGTGIAPFRSMIAERDAVGASGHNWLLFGEDDFVTDFYYQTEIQAWVETGSLHHVNLAFRKNRHQSLSVADLILKEAKQLWQWIELGAYLMVSGEKDPMGQQVEQALQQVIADRKGVGQAEASAYLKQLAKDGRYVKELY
jgi:sulfite reductase (NADPH) flavoprotein alpha-component